MTEAPIAALEALDRVRRMGAETDGSYRRRDDSWVARARTNLTGAVYTSAREDPRDPKTITGELGALVSSHGWRTSLDVGAILQDWERFVGADVAEHCTPETFDPPVLTVRTSSTTWATQMRVLQAVVLDKLEKELGHRVVEEIKILGPTQRSFKKGRRSVAGRGPRDTWG